MSALKKIVFNEDENKKSDSDNSSTKKPIFYYNDYGFTQAGVLRGRPTALRIQLSKLYMGFTEKERVNVDKEKEKDKNLEIEKTTLETEKEKLLGKIENIEKVKLIEIDDKVKEIKTEITEIEADPESVDIEKPDKLGFYLAVSIIFFLTIYLWIFYSSATYSAFFREIKFTKNAVFNSIFYSNSISESAHMGLAALLLTLVSPFIFIALGYLIHKFTERKKIQSYLAVGLLILVTFAFDCILAYEITKKIYEALALNSLKDMPPYTTGMAVQDANFWLIIFAGFIVYIVWGLILRFVAEGFKGFDAVKSAIRKRRDHIKELNAQKTEASSEIYKFKDEIIKLDGQINEINQKIGGEPFRWKDFEKIVLEFMDGWIRYLTAGNSSDEKLDEAEAICNNFLQTVKATLK